MATHSSILAGKTPWREEPGRLQSIGSQSQTQLSEHIRIRDHLGKVSGGRCMFDAQEMHDILS